MQYENYIPRILLCGDDADFFTRVDSRPYKIIGHAKISGEVDGQKFNVVEDGKVFFNDELHDFDALKNFLLGGEVDYLVFTKLELFLDYHRVAVEHQLISPKAVTVEQFNNLPREFFYDVNVNLHIFDLMKIFSVKTLLDVDGFFAKAKIFTKPDNEDIEIDCVTEKNLPPIAENIYNRVYKDLAEIGLKKYDAVFLTERTPTDFDAAFILTENFSDVVFSFGRTDGELKNYLVLRANNFAEAGAFQLTTGDLFYLKRHRPPESFRTFVVTHKATPHEYKLPDGYEIIHAGHALGNDFGYIGDDTGDNISDLNLYINELTALYWIWKNSSDSVVGLCHYRRFFTTGDETFAYEKILTRDDALKILEKHDMIVLRLFCGVMTQREFIENDCGKILAKIGEAIFRKHLLRVHPDYIDAFDFVMNSKAVFKCNMFITRREILDAYCKWLFAFLLDVTKETLQVVPLEELPYTPRRLMSFMGERMLHVWLFKQRLRLKELNFMFIDGI